MENINVLKYLTDSNIAEFIIAILLVTLVYALIRNGIKAKSKKMPLYLLGIFSIFILLSFYKTLMFPYLVSCGLFIFSLYVFYKQFIRWQSSCKPNLRLYRIKFLAATMFLLWSFGTCLYQIAFTLHCPQIYALNVIDKPIALYACTEMTFRSMICSLDLFMLDVDTNIIDSISEHYLLKSLISTVAIFSFLCTVLLLLSLISERLKAYIALRNLKITQERNHLYLFFGANEPSKLLAKDIHRHDSNAVIITIAKSQNNDDADNSSDVWSSIVQLFSHSRKTFEMTEEANTYLAIADTRITDLFPNGGPSDIFTMLNLTKIKELISQLSLLDKSELHIFFLSENEENNITCMQALGNDTSVNLAAKHKRNVNIYYHAHHNNITQALEDQETKVGINIHLVDASAACINSLKMEEELHPVNFVELDTTDNIGTVTSSFDSLVIGFGETGQEATKFLYEYGAFVDCHSMKEDDHLGIPTGHVYRSPFHCHIIDTNMEELKGEFFSISRALAYRKNSSDGSPLITTHQTTANSTTFYDLLHTLSPTLNYVVVAVGSDIENLSIAINIYRFLLQECDNLKHLKILIKCKNVSNKAKFQKILSYYNEECAKNKEKKKQVLSLFGADDEVYTYENIIHNHFMEEGIAYNYKYYENATQKDKEKNLWDKRRNRAIRDKELTKYSELHRKEGQDLANAYHSKTKLKIFRANGSDTQNKLLMLNLARLEHIRWNASHETMGYLHFTEAPEVPNTHNCNERIKRHNCLLPWELLDQESKETTEAEGWNANYKEFDRNVVNLTIEIYSHQK
jgi:hypothetical protein